MSTTATRNNTTNTGEFRRFPKNTWRLVRLRERYLTLRYAEDLEEQESYTHPLRPKKSHDHLRHQLIENLSSLDLNSNKKQTRFVISEKQGQDQMSISSLPSLSTTSTVSPMSPNLAFTFQSPPMTLNEVSPSTHKVRSC